MKLSLRLLRMTLPWIVVGSVGYFFYQALANSQEQLRDLTIGLNGVSFLSILAFTLAVIVSGLLWGRLLSLLARTPVAQSDAVRIHSASWLLKYIPGQVGSYLNKIAWAHSRGISKKTTSTTFIYENVLMVFAGVMLSIPILIAASAQIFSQNIAILVSLLALAPLLLVFTRPLFYGVLNLLMRKAKRKEFQRSDFLTTGQLLKFQFFYFVPRILNGVGFVLLASTVFVIEPSMYIGLAATYILASIVGLLAIFVPGGLGVREAVIVAFASIYIPIEQAIILSLLARLFATLSDVGVAGIYLTLNKGRIRQQ